MNTWYPSTEADDVGSAEDPYSKRLRDPSNPFVLSAHYLPFIPDNSSIIVVLNHAYSISNNPMLWKSYPACFSPGPIVFAQSISGLKPFFVLMRSIRTITMQHDFI